MKKFFIILIALILILVMTAGCTDKKVEPEEETPTVEVPKDIIQDDPSQADFAAGHVAITDFEMIQDENDNTYAKIYYSFTNSGTSAVSFSDSVSCSAYQGNSELSRANYTDDQTQAVDQKVNPGETIMVAVMYVLRDFTTTVKAEASDRAEGSSSPTIYVEFVIDSH